MESPDRRRLSQRLLTLLAAVLLGLTPGCHPPAESTAGKAVDLPAADVRVQPVVRGSHQAMEEVVGTVRPRTRALIEAKVSGRIARLVAVPGSRVTEGAVLAELEAAEFRARVEQAEAVLGQANRDLARFRTLLSSETVTQSEFEAVESRQRVAQASLAEAQTLLGYTRVTAPFAGTVTRRLADEGSLAGPGRPLLELEDSASQRFEADLPASLLDRIALGDRHPVALSGMDRPVEGVVSEIEPAADAATRTFRVRLDLPRDAGARAGTFGRMSLPLGESPVLVVPTNAVVRRGQMELVYVAVDGRAQLRLVRTGKISGATAELLSGVEPGESVVVEGVTGLREGQPLRVL